jgi:LysM repeat protein
MTKDHVHVFQLKPPQGSLDAFEQALAVQRVPLVDAVVQTPIELRGDEVASTTPAQLAQRRAQDLLGFSACVDLRAVEEIHTQIVGGSQTSDCSSHIELIAEGHPGAVGEFAYLNSRSAKMAVAHRSSKVSAVLQGRAPRALLEPLARGIINPVQYNDSVRFTIIAAALLVTACTPVTSNTTPAAPRLHPYLTTTPSATADQLAGVVVTADTPLPTPTPSQYTIKAGDTLGQIAEQFRITLDALLAANPNVNPGALRVGDTLHIPASPADFAGEATPTPVAFRVQQAACHPTASGAVWCFVLVLNDTSDVIENVTAQITLLDSSGSAIDSKAAALPLDILPPGTSLPLSVLFPPPLPLEVRPQVSILTAIRLLPGDKRYLPVQSRNTITQVSWLGRSADVSGEAFLSEGSASARDVWIVGVAYDRAGELVGWRRWESTGALPAGSSIPFSLFLSSVAGGIERVEIVLQARP